MTRFNNSRTATRLVAGFVALVTFATVASAVETIATPNAAFVSYSLAPGANSGAITPAANQATLVMGTQTAVGFRGVGQVSMLRVPSSFLEWVGLESPAGAAIAQGFSGSPGVHIVYLDYAHKVDIQVNSTDTFRIHNGYSTTATGNVTLIW